MKPFRQTILSLNRVRSNARGPLRRELSIRNLTRLLNAACILVALGKRRSRSLLYDRCIFWSWIERRLWGAPELLPVVTAVDRKVKMRLRRACGRPCSIAWPVVENYQRKTSLFWVRLNTILDYHGWRWLGGNPETQREFLGTLKPESPKRPQDRHKKKPLIANDFALGYTYQDVLDADQEGKVLISPVKAVAANATLRYLG